MVKVMPAAKTKNLFYYSMSSTESGNKQTNKYFSSPDPKNMEGIGAILIQ